MSHTTFCFTVDDVGYDGYSSEAHLERLLEFCEAEGLRATLFIVPRCGGRTLGQRPQYVRLLREAAARGHECAQHGLDHERFECGIPPRMILDLPHEGPARQRLAEHRAEIDAALSVPNLRRTLATGRAILQDALGLPILGFRAPCASKCDNLFRALEEEGYEYDSSHVLQDAGWDIINGVPNVVFRPITRAAVESFQTGGRLRELPLSSEYTWYPKRDTHDIRLRLAKHDFDACGNAGVPFIPVCHVSPIQEGEDDLGFALFRELAAYAKGRSVSSTLATAGVLRPGGPSPQGRTIRHCSQSSGTPADATGSQGGDKR